MHFLKNQGSSTAKFLWHLNFWLFFLKKKFRKKKIDQILDHCQKNQFIDYYCKVSGIISDTPSTTLNDISLTSNSGYSYDLYRILINFPDHLRFNFLRGDLNHVPAVPTFVKCRPIYGNNANAILLPLVTHRHLRFIDDPKSYKDKKSMAVWRGAAYQKHRRQFLIAAKNLPFCDVADTSRNALKESPNNYLSIEEQLQYKIIFSIEGNDVASNLKWIMSSNSLCFSLPLVYETWFREGTLVPGKHFVEIKPDFSDIKEKIDYYINHPDQAEKIIKNAQSYVANFKNLKYQYQLAEQVALKYFQITNQL